MTEVSSAHQRELLLDDRDDIVQGAGVYDNENSTSCRPIWLESPGRSGTTGTPVGLSRGTTCLHPTPGPWRASRPSWWRSRSCTAIRCSEVSMATGKSRSCGDACRLVDRRAGGPRLGRVVSPTGACVGARKWRPVRVVRAQAVRADRGPGWSGSGGSDPPDRRTEPAARRPGPAPRGGRSLPSRVRVAARGRREETPPATDRLLRPRCRSHARDTGVARAGAG